ncbi:plasmid maintenance protein CcdB [Nitratireductor mangrovi]|uniref:Toxin CcdB n=1 Tax=Nitratireductor mangrovi TaxID=2599600 RepID=A0A5B8L132_9HYPH|nr:CcdB family protein [Nitratireductor mangrovi]QDZ01400.1 plasmid maintenance protein CcdB [Nitratireductor mangrovi]
MARYDVYRFQDTSRLLLDVQTDLLDDLDTRAVVPLVSEKQMPPIANRLNPVFQIEGGGYVMATQFIGVVPAVGLKEPVAHLAEAHDEIVAALDMLFHGF